MKILFIYLGSDDNPRAAKVCRSLLDAGHSVVFVGWERNSGKAKRSLVPATEYSMMSYPSLSDKLSLKAVGLFYWHVTKALFLHRPDTVHCVNEEVAALVLLFKRIFYRHLVCDVFDSFAYRYSSTSISLSVLLHSVVAFVYTIADKIIVTDQRRYKRLNRFKYKATIVENSPIDPGSNLARKMPTGDIKVFFSGNISVQRGANVVISALDQVPNLKILAAGFLDKFSEEKFIKHPQVNYLGVIEPSDSLEVLADCDAVLALYEPVSENHILASPSKIFDAMSVGRPVIVNSEAEVSQWVLEQGIGFAVPYYDLEALANLFISLAEFRTQIQGFSRRVRKLFLREYSWHIMEARLLELYNQMEVK